MGEISDYFKNKKNLVSLLVLGILILGIPLGVNLVKLQQIIKSRAAVDPIVFTGPNVKQKSDNSWVATKPQIQLQLTSPLGPPGTPAPSSSPTAAPTSTPTPTSSVTPTPSQNPAGSGFTCNGATATLYWGGASTGYPTLGHILRFNKDPENDWTGPGDFVVGILQGVYSYTTGSLSGGMSACSWGTDHNDQHCTNCSGQQSTCTTSGVNTSLTSGAHYKVTVIGNQGAGVPSSSVVIDVRCP